MLVETKKNKLNFEQIQIKTFQQEKQQIKSGFWFKNCGNLFTKVELKIDSQIFFKQNDFGVRRWI